MSPAPDWSLPGLGPIKRALAMESKLGSGACAHLAVGAGADRRCAVEEAQLAAAAVVDGARVGALLAAAAVNLSP